METLRTVTPRSQHVIGEALAPVLVRARRLAPHLDESLLVLGETGVGKEWLAREIHAASGRSGAFVAVNVGGLSAEMFELELFGSVRGAFTDAVERQGRVPVAEGGTLFLDEIGDLCPKAQVRLLRFLQDARWAPVGSIRESMADVRIVAATNKPVESLLAGDGFRADLLYRFAPPLEIPPLRARRDEILPLALARLDECCQRRGLAPCTLSDDAREFLIGHAWPGNIRQLHALLSSVLLDLDGSIIDATALRAVARPQPPPPGAACLSWRSFQERREAEERAWLRERFEAEGASVERTARRLGCPPSTLRHSLVKHGLLPRPPRAGGPVEPATG